MNMIMWQALDRIPVLIPQIHLPQNWDLGLEFPLKNLALDAMVCASDSIVAYITNL